MRHPATSTLEAADAAAGVVFPLIILVALGLAAFWLWFLIDALSWPRATWSAAGLSRARWVMRIVLLGVIGAVLYLSGPRRELRTAYVAVRRRA